MNLGKFGFYAHRGALYLRKYGPTIATYFGIGSMVAGEVVACRQTLKLEETLDAGKKRLEEAQNAAYSSEGEKKKAVLKARAENAKDLAKLYWLPAGLTVGGAVSIGVGHGKLNARYLGAAAALKATDSAYKAYRNRVAEKFGEEAEREIHYALEKKKIEKTATDEKGKEKKVEETVYESKLSGEYSQYARCFDEFNPNYDCDSNNTFYNQTFLIKMQDYFNDRLRAVGHVFLNEVYEKLGFKHSPDGAIVGWLWTEDGSTANKIDFGIFDDTENSRLFVNGLEPAIWLDFNVDGPIYDLI